MSGPQVRLDEDVAEWVDEQRAEDDRSRAAVVNELLRDMSRADDEEEGDDLEADAPPVTVRRQGAMTVSVPRGRRRARGGSRW